MNMITSLIKLFYFILKLSGVQNQNYESMCAQYLEVK